MLDAFRGHRVRVVSLAIVVSLVAGCTAEARKARSLKHAEEYYEQGKAKAAILEYHNVLKYDAGNKEAITRLGILHFDQGELGNAYRFLIKAKELDPSNVDVRVRLGTMLLLARQPEKAREEAEFVLKNDPNNLMALSLVANTSESPEELDRAIKDIEARKASLGEPANVGRVLGALYLRKRDFPKAEAALKEAVAAAPSSVEAHVNLASLEQAKGEVDLAEKEFQAAANADPKDPVGKLRLADFYLQQHKIEDAKRVLTDLTARFPDYLPAWLRTAEVAIAEKKLDEAMKALDAVFDKSPDDRTALMLKGQIQLAQNDTNNALQTYQRVIKNNPKFGPARVQLARAELQAGDTEQAKAQLRRALEATPDYADALFLLSDVNIRSGASAVAIEDLSKYVAKFPKAARAYELLGAAYLRQHQAAQASEAYRKRVALAPDDPRGQYLLATSLRAEGKTQEARRLLEDILTKAPSAVDPLGQLVLMDFAEKKPDAALERVKRQIQKAPDTAALYFVLGGVYQRRGELDLAAQAHKKALSLDPNGFGSYKDLAQIYIAQGKTADGLAMLAKAHELRPKDATIPILTGMVQQQQGDFAKAQASYEEAWQLDPKSAVAANNLAWILAHKTGDQEKALALAQEAKELAPEDPSVSDTLGWILYQRGIYQRAATLLKDASEKLPQNAEIRYHYAMALLKTGDESGARHELTQALAGSPTFDGVEEARAALGRMH